MADEDKEIGVRTNVRFTKAIELVARGDMTNDQVMAAVPVSKATFYKWAKTKEFTQALMEIHQETFKGMIPEALKTLRECLKSTNQKVRLDAAKTILDKTMPDSIDSNRDDEGKTVVNIQVNYV
jgi:hypothetical protein